MRALSCLNGVETLQECQRSDARMTERKCKEGAESFFDDDYDLFRPSSPRTPLLLKEGLGVVKQALMQGPGVVKQARMQGY